MGFTFALLLSVITGVFLMIYAGVALVLVTGCTGVRKRREKI